MASRDAVKQVAPVWGLVLCGGEGRRLGRDKGLVEYHGVSQARWAYGLLAAVCERAYVSVRVDQASGEAYAGLPLVTDVGGRGPAAGLGAAWAQWPDVAWLVLAADLPLVSEGMLNELLRMRNSSAFATGYRHGDGVLEPLCTIWEPRARPAVRAALDSGSASLRRLLESSRPETLDIVDPVQLRSVNTPQDEAELRARLAH